MYFYEMSLMCYKEKKEKLCQGVCLEEWMFG